MKNLRYYAGDQQLPRHNHAAPTRPRGIAAGRSRTGKRGFAQYIKGRMDTGSEHLLR